jgi:hypothetical protein
MAAGMGARYGGLKQIDPVGPGGETILDYSIYDALRAGFGKLVFVIRKEIEQPFRQIVGARFEKRIAVEYVFQELDALSSVFSVPADRTKPWGTAHAVRVASRAIREPFAVINANDFYGAEGYRLLVRHLQSGTMDYAMAGFVLRNTLSDFGAVARGVCQVSGDDFLQRVVELTQIECDGKGGKNSDVAGHVARLTGDEMVSMNMWGFSVCVKTSFGGHILGLLNSLDPIYCGRWCRKFGSYADTLLSACLLNYGNILKGFLSKAVRICAWNTIFRSPCNPQVGLQRICH